MLLAKGRTVIQSPKCEHRKFAITEDDLSFLHCKLP